KVLGDGGLPSHDTRRWQSGPSLEVSLDRLDAVLGYCDAHDIRMYRMATGLAPYASHPELRQFRDAPARCAERPGPGRARAGARARELDIRLSTHPGQYTVLNSHSDAVQRAAVEELEVQAELLDGMGLGPEAVVVLHVGGAAGGLDRFAAGFEQLSDAARARL